MQDFTKNSFEFFNIRAEAWDNLLQDLILYPKQIKIRGQNATKFARNRDEQLGVRQLERVYMEIDPTYTNLLGSYGMKRLRELARVFRGMIAEKILTKDEFRYLIDSFTFYTNMLAQWSYFYYPWGIGCACFRFDEEHQTYVPETEG